MPNPPNIAAASQIATLLEFKWGSAGVARYARWTSNVAFGGNTFASLPAIEVSYGKQDGSLTDVPAVIQMQEVSPLDQMRYSFPPVRVTIWEIRPGEDGTAKVRFKGRITNVGFRFNNRAKTCQVQVSSFKSSLKGSLSLTVSQFCTNIYGRRPCRANIEAQKEIGTLTVVNGQEVTITGLTTLTDPAWWFNGEVHYDGYGICIFSQPVSGVNKFLLLEPAPPFWAGKTVSVYPGCAKDIESCRDPRRNQEDRFMGLGTKIVDRNINFEE